jgi:hypothetical protein
MRSHSVGVRLQILRGADLDAVIGPVGALNDL